MSKFVEAIEAQLTGRHEYLPQDLKDRLHASLTKIEIDSDTLSCYRIGVQWGKIVRCRDEDIGNLIENLIKQLKIDLYGDIREHILAMERAFYERKEDEMRSQIHKILKIVGLD
jgi:hypothetical protein